MSYLDRLHKGRGVMPHLVETVEYAGAAYGFGYLQNRYREKASVLGMPVDLLAGVVLKGAALSSELLGKGASGWMTSLANNVGNAGVGAFFHTMGAGHGAHAAGVKRMLLTSAADVAKAKAALPGATILGEIPKAPHGDFLSAAELAELAR